MASVTTSTFAKIPQTVLDAGYNKPVHVEGWKAGCVFTYLGERNGYHAIKAAKTGRVYYTKNDLCYTRRNTPTPTTQHQ